MAILSECPICRRKQASKNKICINCNNNMDKSKRSKRVQYWIAYRLAGKQRREPVGFSITEARDKDAKRGIQKNENQIIDRKLTFNDLTKWYCDLETVKYLDSYSRIKLAMKNFNDVFGGKRVNSIKPIDIENYQLKREKEGRAPATIDMEVKIVQTAVTKAFDNDEIDGQAIKSFRRVKRKLRKGSNARRRILTVEEYLRLEANSPSHLKKMLKMAYNTGMRAGEIRTLQWSYIDKDKKFIRLPAKVVKESKSKTIPINHHVKAILDSIPRAIHHDFVFTYNGMPIKQKDGYKRSFRTACKNAEIPCGRKTPNGITFHDFRRTVKSNMLNAGVSKIHCDLILGHSLQGMDVNYIVPDDDALRIAMEKYTQWLDDKIAHVPASVDQTVDHE